MFRTKYYDFSGKDGQRIKVRRIEACVIIGQTV